MSQIERRAIAHRRTDTGPAYETPDGDIPDLERYLDRYVDGRAVSDGLSAITAEVEDGDVVRLYVPLNCASKQARIESDGTEGHRLVIQPGV